MQNVIEIMSEEESEKENYHGHTRIIIEDLEVFFPYEPYDSQIQYMKTVIKALNHEGNALLEFTSAGGKTLCLLCSILAWIENKELKGEKISPKFRIIYTSRTHLQLMQVMKEFNKTIYSKSKTAVIIASKQNYCINENFKGLSNEKLKKNCYEACRKKHYNNNLIQKCKYFENIKSEKKFEKLKNKFYNMNITQLKMNGEFHEFCPYYYSSKISNHVDLLLLPYNYVLEQKLFQKQGLELKNSILIFDEAHNVEDFSEKGCSFEISVEILDNTVVEVNNLYQRIENENMNKKIKFNSTLKSIDDVIESIFSLKDSIKKFILNKQQAKKENCNENTLIINGNEIFQILESVFKFSIQKMNIFENFLEIILNLIKDLTLIKENNIITRNFHYFLNSCLNLYQCNYEFLQNKKMNKNENEINHYKLIINYEYKNYDFILKLLCLSPSFGINFLKNEVRNFILTSNCLAQLKNIESQLSIKFEFKFNFSEAIHKKSNLFAGIIKKGSENNLILNFSFDKRANNKVFLI